MFCRISNFPFFSRVSVAWSVALTCVLAWLLLGCVCESIKLDNRNEKIKIQRRREGKIVGKIEGEGESEKIQARKKRISGGVGLLGVAERSGSAGRGEGFGSEGEGEEGRGGRGLWGEEERGAGSQLFSCSASPSNSSSYPPSISFPTSLLSNRRADAISEGDARDFIAETIQAYKNKSKQIKNN
jgi:hypothetical protein